MRALDLDLGKEIVERYEPSIRQDSFCTALAYTGLTPQRARPPESSVLELLWAVTPDYKDRNIYLPHNNHPQAV